MLTDRRKDGRQVQDRTVSFVQAFLKDLDEYSTTQNLPPFGSALSSSTPLVAVEATVVHRIRNKLEVPIKGNESSRRESSIKSMLDRACAPVDLDWSNDDMRMARARLSCWFVGFRPTYRFVAPTGASALSNGGEDDIVTKLSDLRNWEVSPDLVNYAVNIAYNNHQLKKLVKQRFREVYGEDRGCYYAAHRKMHGLKPYTLFKAQFKMVVTYNAVSRVTAVPKDNASDRPISCEPVWNMVCQLSFMRDMRDHISRRLGINIDTLADLHKIQISQDVATIDLKTASDLISLPLIEGLWPLNVFKHLAVLRPSVLEYEGEYFTPVMFAPMGTGVTFDVMTLTLLALLRFDRSASVFGDDIIIKPEFVERALRVLADSGLVVNSEKSFFGGPFKESCGGYYMSGLGYITSYDFKYPATLTGRILLINKCNSILAARQVGFELMGIIERFRNALVSLCPRDVLGPMEIEVTDQWITGLTGNRLKSRLISALESLWHRPVVLTRRCTTVSLPSERESCVHTEIAFNLFRGVTERKQTKTRVKRELVDTWTGTVIRTVPIQPIILTI